MCASGKTFFLRRICLIFILFSLFFISQYTSASLDHANVTVSTNETNITESSLLVIASDTTAPAPSDNSTPVTGTPEPATPLLGNSSATPITPIPTETPNKTAVLPSTTTGTLLENISTNISSTQPTRPGPVSGTITRNTPELDSEKILGKRLPQNMAPANQKFLRYVQSHHQQSAGTTSRTASVVGSSGTGSGHGMGLVPPPVSMSYLHGTFAVEKTGSSHQPSIGSPPVVGGGTLPSSYDIGTLEKVPSVKDQGPANVCWVFATYDSLESYLLPNETWDFSENNMKDLLSSAYPQGYDRNQDDGGNTWMSTAYLARWTGPINETDDPYNPYSGVSPTGMPADKHVQNVYFIPPRQNSTDNANIKNAILEYGAVTTDLYMDDQDPTIWNQATGSYYYSGSEDQNHMVTLVGWNDNYDRHKFSQVPPGNGAFIAENSWGTGWGNSGFFNISYYDTQTGTDDNAVFTAESPQNYDNVYQYDPLGMTEQAYYGTPATGWIANLFTSNQTGALSAISFYTTDTNTTYHAYVYTNPDTASVLNSHGAAWSGSGTFMNAGYHTVPVSPLSTLSARKHLFCGDQPD